MPCLKDPALNSLEELFIGFTDTELPGCHWVQGRDTEVVRLCPWLARRP